MTHFTIGENLGKILLEIAQTEIQKGNLDKVFSTYTDSLIDFPQQYVMSLLKNEMVLVTNENHSEVLLSDETVDIENNKSNIFDWNFIMKKKLSDLSKTCKDINRFRLYDFDFYSCDDDTVAEFANAIITDSKLIQIEKEWWKTLENKVKDVKESKYERNIFDIVNYIQNIKDLYTNYKSYCQIFDFLKKLDLVERPQFFEQTVEKIIVCLSTFSNAQFKYNFDTTQEYLSNYQVNVMNYLKNDEFGKQFTTNGIIEKNIMDGYDAGWLSPDGKFYGANGETNQLLHLILGEQLLPKSEIPEVDLEREGWLKIHYDEVYGYFDENLCYCPTQIQIQKVCDYIDKFHKGVLRTQPRCSSCSEPISTYKLRQMDKIKLHEWFSK